MCRCSANNTSCIQASTFLSFGWHGRNDKAVMVTTQPPWEMAQAPARIACPKGLFLWYMTEDYPHLTNSELLLTCSRSVGWSFVSLDQPFCLLISMPLSPEPSSEHVTWCLVVSFRFLRALPPGTSPYIPNKYPEAWKDQWRPPPQSRTTRYRVVRGSISVAWYLR